MKTRQQQVKEVAQGLALGLITLGVDIEFRSMTEFESASNDQNLWMALGG